MKAKAFCATIAGFHFAVLAQPYSQPDCGPVLIQAPPCAGPVCSECAIRLQYGWVATPTGLPSIATTGVEYSGCTPTSAVIQDSSMPLGGFRWYYSRRETLLGPNPGAWTPAFVAITVPPPSLPEWVPAIPSFVPVNFPLYYMPNGAVGGACAGRAVTWQGGANTGVFLVWRRLLNQPNTATVVQEVAANGVTGVYSYVEQNAPVGQVYQYGIQARGQLVPTGSSTLCLSQIAWSSDTYMYSDQSLTSIAQPPAVIDDYTTVIVRRGSSVMLNSGFFGVPLHGWYFYNGLAAPDTLIPEGSNVAGNFAGTQSGTLTFAEAAQTPSRIYSRGFNGCALGYGRKYRVLVQCSVADVASSGQIAEPDNAITPDDIIVYIGWFVASDMRADVASAGQVEGADGALSADDQIYFINRYFAGCE